MEREVLPVDILFVGAGPANLAAAIDLARTLRRQGKEMEIVVIEKGQSVGSHILSGAVMDPRGMAELFPDWLDQGCPVEAKVTKEAVYHLTSGRAWKAPIVPPMLANHGFYVVTLSDVVIWMKDKLEQLGVMVFEGFPGNEILYDGDRVIGVRTMDKGLSSDGAPGPNHEPGADIHAKVTVLGEGSHGSLTKQLVARLALEGPNPQIFGTGCKEVWKLPPGRFEAGRVIHSSGFPATNSVYAGSWIYGMANDKVSIGYVTALDGRQPWLDPWQMFQSWKSHPFVKRILDGGEILKAGAKTVPEGGYFSRPRSYGDGFLILGDSGSLLNISRLKGIHAAIKSGLMAAKTILEAIEADDFSASTLKRYEYHFQSSWLKDELYKVRNWRAEFQSGFLLGGLKAGLKYVLGDFSDLPKPLHADHSRMLKKSEAASRPQSPEYDGKFLIDKVTQVYHAGAIHDEHQPSHLRVADLDICRTKCAEEYGNPCESFCPANVYEMVPSENGSQRLQINFSNCVHCKTCDILDPYQIIEWTVPSDAGGPKYHGL